MRNLKTLLASAGMLALAALSSAAFAQTAPSLTYGQVLTPAQWTALFAGKQDYLGAPPVLTTGGVMTGPLFTAASIAASAGLNLSPGTAPTSPNNGDMWVTPSGLFVQANGTTFGPLIGGSSSTFANTSPITLSFPSGVVTYACPTCGVTGSPLSQFASTTSAQLAGVISDETGSGAVVFATSPTLVTPNLGTPSAAVLTHGTGLPISTGVSGLGTGIASFLGTPSSANLAAAVTGGTGSGALVFGTSPTIATPNITTGFTIGGAAASGAYARGNGVDFVSSAIQAADLPLASASAFGAVKVDNTTIIASGGVISAIGASATAVTPGTTGVIGGTVGDVLAVGAGPTLIQFSPAPITNSLASNVTISGSSYTDGPSVAQGTTGTWVASGQVTFVSPASPASIPFCKLWDGTTVIDSSGINMAVNSRATIALSGWLASPVGNIRISCEEQNGAATVMQSNTTGLGKDSTISAHRIQ